MIFVIHIICQCVWSIVFHSNSNSNDFMHSLYFTLPLSFIHVLSIYFRFLLINFGTVRFETKFFVADDDVRKKIENRWTQKRCKSNAHIRNFTNKLASGEEWNNRRTKKRHAHLHTWSERTNEMERVTEWMYDGGGKRRRKRGLNLYEHQAIE